MKSSGIVIRIIKQSDSGWNKGIANGYWNKKERDIEVIPFSKDPRDLEAAIDAVQYLQDELLEALHKLYEDEDGYISEGSIKAAYKLKS